MEFDSVIYKTSLFIEPTRGIISIKKYKARKTKTGYMTTMILNKRILSSDINVIKKDNVKDSFNYLSRYAFTLNEEDARKISVDLMKELANLTNEISKNMSLMSQRLSKTVDTNLLTVEDFDITPNYSSFKFTEEML